MNNIQIFNSPEFGEIRTIERDGEPWFVAADVCAVFGETNRNRAMQALDDDEKGYTQMNTPGGNQKVSVVNESGLYSLLFAMQPTKARGVSAEHIEQRQAQLKKFKRWVTSEVIPSIRKHGAYMTPAKIEEVLLNPDTIIQLATALKEEQAAHREAQAKIEADKPKVLFADAVSTAKTSILVGELAKIMRQNNVEIGEKRLFQWLRENGYLIKRKCSDYNTPTQYSMELGLFEVKETPIIHSDGHVTVSKTTKVTGKGQQYFVNKFLSRESYGEGGAMSNKLNIDLLYSVLSEILSDKYNCKVTFTVTPKDKQKKPAKDDVA